MLGLGTLFLIVYELHNLLAVLVEEWPGSPRPPSPLI
jgi:hypothetical protein